MFAFIASEAQAKGVQACIRLIGHCRDLPAAFVAADTVVVPAIAPPVLGRVVAQAQAMGRPVVTADLGILPEHVATPPEIPENVRTGWVAKAGDARNSPARSAPRLPSTMPPTRRWRCVHGSSRNTCFPHGALPWPPARSTRHCSRSTPRGAGAFQCASRATSVAVQKSASSPRQVRNADF